MTPDWLQDVEPTHEGNFGKAYLLDDPEENLDDPRLALYVPKTYFLFYFPTAHPAWDWHLLMTHKLDDIQGVDPPHLHYAGAKYEVAVWALDPNLPAPDPRKWPLGQDPPAVALLSPPDAEVQFHGPNDDQLPEMIDKIAQAVVVGWLVPDTDFRQNWTATLQKTAEHYRGHPEHN